MSEPDQYDTTGELYERVKYLPVGIPEQATVLSALPALRGKSLLDVGCGTGFYPRLLKGRGAERVAGVDASVEMIRYAQRVEAANPLGISYGVHDAATLPTLGSFDELIWYPAIAPDEAVNEFGADFWSDFLENPTFAVATMRPRILQDG